MKKISFNINTWWNLIRKMDQINALRISLTNVTTFYKTLVWHSTPLFLKEFTNKQHDTKKSKFFSTPRNKQYQQK